MHRALIIAPVAVALTAAATGAAFVFGTPQTPPSPSAASSAPAPVPPGGGAAPDAAASPAQPGGPGGSPMGGEIIVDGEVPEPDPSSPFTFQIPGCTCHSDDPAVVEEHASYRLNQCAGCHRSR